MAVEEAPFGKLASRGRVFVFKREGRTVSISSGLSDPHFLEGPWPSNKSWYRKQPLLVPGSTANISTLLSLFHAPSGAGSFRGRSLHEIERHCRSTCHLPCVSQSPREASKPDYSKRLPLPSSSSNTLTLSLNSRRGNDFFSSSALPPRKFLYRNNYKSWNSNISCSLFLFFYITFYNFKFAKKLKFQFVDSQSSSQYLYRHREL